MSILVKLLAAAGFCLVGSVALVELYDLVRHILGAVVGRPVPSWVAAATVHTAVVPIWLVLRWQRFGFFSRWPLITRKMRIRSGYACAVALLTGAFIAAVGSRLLWDGATSRAITSRDIWWITWIPLVEEVAFRGLLSRFFRQLTGNTWGAYFSALLFALVHTDISMQNILSGTVSVPLGPLLLGITAEILLGRTGHLRVTIAWHAAANATAVVFAWLDGRWLEWLGLLYE